MNLAEYKSTLETTQAEVEQAHLLVAAMMEIIGHCGPEEKLTAGLILGLLRPVRTELDSANDALAVLAKASGE